jgi:serine O-acetyltransferase
MIDSDDADMLNQLYDMCYDMVHKTLKHYQWALGLTDSNIAEIYTKVSFNALPDLIALKKLDPAAISIPYIIETYGSFRAVVGYRITNHIYCVLEVPDEQLKRRLARKIAEDIKSDTGVDIHPAAIIGSRFVIDHGVNTVIGETSKIGSDFCIIGEQFHVLQGVILGTRDVKNNPPGKRHPTIGNNVTICGCTRVLGPVNIGDDVFISPCSVITDDIPSSHKVIIVNQLQLLKNNNSALTTKEMKIYGVVPESDYFLTIYGCNFRNVEIEILNYKMDIIEDIHTEKIYEDENQVKFMLNLNQNVDKEKLVKSILLKYEKNEIPRKIFINSINTISVRFKNDRGCGYITKSAGLSDILDQMIWGCINGN